jgi:hypothetical protein
VLNFVFHIQTSKLKLFGDAYGLSIAALENTGTHGVALDHLL